ncbi:hypothetical protein SAMN05216184_107113 [Georgenia satyanarayanai]|uniref:Uncharacterized protein n=1 Tax=Georgenia satyanarayanai TaxID=860221 RepID=A0A2Y9AG88_9MICO|nr:hypothetical protein [Georgenia satyanarayanai]PYF99403.1 hypothetical protein A8987_107113 [Georgenia satyanarayanai]SSA43215.1 hypothetical protein SAMN05216184_107113 [Georgenia satyanarayanai]
MSKKLAVAALGVVLLVAGAAVAFDRGAGVVAVVLLGLVVGVGTVAAIDTNQKVRWQQRHFTRWQRASEERMTVVEDELLRRGAHVEAATQDDVLGTVRLMQEQYVARLDRAQTDLEQAAAALRAATGASRQE